MQKLIIDVKTGQKQIIDFTPKEESDRLAEIALAEQEEQARLDKENEKAAALQRLQTEALSDAVLADLLILL